MRRYFSIPVVFIAVCFACDGFAQTDTTQKFIVGTKEAPPFAIKTEHGWKGISVELWEVVAGKLKLETEWREMALPELLAGLEKGELDAVAAALTVTPDRETAFDFSHPFYAEGLGIAVSERAQKRRWAVALANLLSPDFLGAIGILIVVLLSVGVVIWFFERRKNADQFGGKASEGLWSGFWWSAVTMTTVGYGDKAPRTVGGRIVGIIWMFAAIFIISSITAMIASSLTVTSLEYRIQGPEDLHGAWVGTLAASTSEDYLMAREIKPRAFESVEEALRALKQGEIDAVVYDAPLLNYLVKTRFKGGIAVLPNTFEPQHYAIGLKTGSLWREPVNRALLEEIHSDRYQSLLEKYT